MHKHCHNVPSCDSALCWKAGRRATGEDSAHHSTTEPQPPTPQHAGKHHTNHLLLLDQLHTNQTACTDWAVERLIASINDMATSHRGRATVDGWIELQLEEALVMHYTLENTPPADQCRSTVHCQESRFQYISATQQRDDDDDDDGWKQSHQMLHGSSSVGMVGIPLCEMENDEFGCNGEWWGLCSIRAHYSWFISLC